MAATLSRGGSGYSGTLSTDPTTRTQQLACDPNEPLAGSTSVSYDPSKVTLTGASAGPGYSNESFQVYVEVEVQGEGPGEVPSLTAASTSECPYTFTYLQPLDYFLVYPAGPETGYVQVRYALSGEAGQIPPPEGFTVVNEAGVDGVDTHALKFHVREEVPADTPTSYTVFAATAGTHGGNDEDFLVTLDGTRIGPAGLTPATVQATPIGGARLVADPANPLRKALFVGGTDGPDVIRFEKAGNGLRVRINGVWSGPFSGFSRVIASGRGGDDDIRMDAKAAYSTVFFGGDGSDRLESGNGESILDGGDGNDLLISGNSRDLLIGGAGADDLRGGNSEDLLVAGRTTYDGGALDKDVKPLVSILTEWTRSTSYSTRIGHITGALPGGLNGSFVLRTAGPLEDRTVFDDGAPDSLLGGNGNDWFIAKASEVCDKLKAETVTLS